MPKVSNTSVMAKKLKSETIAGKELSAHKQIKRNKKIVNTENMVMMPGGQLVDARAYIEARPTFQPSDNIEKFEEFIKDYDPERFSYAWPLVDGPSVQQVQKTRQMIRAGLYIKLKKDDIKANGTVITHEGTEDDVRYYNHVLVKIPKEQADRMYEAPKAMALQKLVSHQQNMEEGVGGSDDYAGMGKVPGVGYEGGKITYGNDN